MLASNPFLNSTPSTYHGSLAVQPSFQTYFKIDINCTVNVKNLVAIHQNIATNCSKMSLWAIVNNVTSSCITQIFAGKFSNILPNKETHVAVHMSFFKRRLYIILRDYRKCGSRTFKHLFGCLKASKNSTHQSTHSSLTPMEINESNFDHENNSNE